ncbi:MAG TPA: alkaline phosphatase [Candidatus Mcinerneyibacteriales bacterium]|nr:alkaline phosphatase [Candidatus Mcinerneyibacteriales bacterium]
MSRIRKIVSITLFFILSSGLLFGAGSERPRYIFLFIGDGMGLSQTAAAELYLNAVNHKSDPIQTRRELSVTSFPVTGLMTTHSADDYITDSAAAGTAMASGMKAKNGFFSSGDKGLLTEHFIKEGYRTAILTNVPADHATPAAFYTRSLHRKAYYEIAREMVRSPVEIIAGSALLGNTPRAKEGKPELFEGDEKRVRVSLDKEKIKWPDEPGARVLLIPDEEMGQFPYTIDDPDNGLMEKAFLSILDRLNEGPFFFVIEGGSIDWACHNNDTATVVREVIAFDRVIRKAVEFYHRYPDETLILVTGDHETGGLALGSETAESLSPALLREQACSSEMMAIRTKNSSESFQDIVVAFFGEDFYLYIKERGKEELLKSRWNDVRKEADFYTRLAFFEELTDLFAGRAGFSWATGGHSGSPVPVWALGEGSLGFTGLYDNFRLYEKILKLIP